MKIYCDITKEDGCIGVIPNPGVEIIFTGTEVHTEPANLCGHPMALRLAEECDFHFWFGKDRIVPPFYTVPKTEIAGYDSRGGYFVSPEDLSLDWSEPLYYIDPMLVCHRIVPVGKTLADMGVSWRETMVSCGDIEVFPDQSAAEERYRIMSLQELLEGKA